jgi:zinc transport system substrate-binding protein
MMTIKRIIPMVLLLLFVAVLVTVGVRHAQGSGTNSPKTLQIVATYYPLYEFAKQVGGSKVSVTNITPAGSEPHEYEPSPRQLIDARRAELFVYNGTGMEPWVTNFLPEYTHTAVKMSQGISVASADPHFWLDPVLAEKMVNSILTGLITASPSDKDYFTARANAYKAALSQLDQDYAAGLATCRLRTIVTAHNAFNYLAKRYNLEVVPIAGMSPDEEPSAAKLAELSGLVRQKGITYIFFENLVSPRLAETLANETGAKTAVFDPIEGIRNEDQQQGKDYLSVQRQNLAALRTALACQ